MGLDLVRPACGTGGLSQWCWERPQQLQDGIPGGFHWERHRAKLDPTLCPTTAALGEMGTGDMQPLQVAPITIWDEFSEIIWESPSTPIPGRQPGLQVKCGAVPTPSRSGGL